MKRAILTIMFGLACATAFAQGRIQFVNDTIHLAYWSFGSSLDGQGVYTANMPAGVVLVADLYMGTSAASLTLQTTTTFSAVAPGKWNAVNYSGFNAPGGTTVFCLTQIRDITFAAPTTWTSNSVPFGGFYGASQEFTFVLGTSTSGYPLMYNHAASLGGGLSTWANGTFNMDSTSPNWRGAIAVGVPEPGSAGLAALGLAVMLTLRRNK